MRWVTEIKVWRGNLKKGEKENRDLVEKWSPGKTREVLHADREESGEIDQFWSKSEEF
jgi:hypothetical protein